VVFEMWGPFNQPKDWLSPNYEGEFLFSEQVPHVCQPRANMGHPKIEN
jgi:hypothetical protein